MNAWSYCESAPAANWKVISVLYLYTTSHPKDSCIFSILSWAAAKGTLYSDKKSHCDSSPHHWLFWINIFLYEYCQFHTSPFHSCLWSIPYRCWLIDGSFLWVGGMEKNKIFLLFFDGQKGCPEGIFVF